MKTSADVVALIDEATEDAAALRLQVSEDRCRRAVDDLLSGYGQNPRLSVHRPGPEPCTCRQPEKTDLLFSVGEVLSLDDERTTYRCTFPQIRRADGSYPTPEDTIGVLIMYDDYFWRRGEREDRGNPVPRPQNPAGFATVDVVVHGEPQRGRTRTCVSYGPVTWHVVS